MAEDEWEDITEKFISNSSKLGIGVLIHGKDFALHDGMTAVEMMHPQMDIGSARSKAREILTPELYAEKGLIPWSCCSYKDLITVFDTQMASYVNWCKGQNLAQTVFACIHVHAIEKIPDAKLKFYTLGMLKLTEITSKKIQAAGIFDDDEFQPFNFGFPMAETKSMTAVLYNLKKIEDDSVKEMKSNINEEFVSGWYGVVSRIRFLKTLLNIINFLSNLDLSEKYKIDDKIHQYFQQIKGLLPILEKTRDLGNVMVTHPDGVVLPMGFEPLYNQQLLPPTLQRDPKLLPASTDVQDFLNSVYIELKFLTKMICFNNFQQFLDFFVEFSDISPTLLSRSIALVMYFPNSRKILGKYVISTTVMEAVINCVNVKVDFDEDKQAYLVERCNSVFWKIAQIYCFNMSRQREKIELEIESIGNYMREIATVFGNRTHLGEDCYYCWVAHQIYKLMEDYLDLGFRLDLYSDYELEYIYWYQSDVIYYSIIKTYRYFQEVQQETKKGLKRKQKLPAPFQREILNYEVKFLIAEAYSVSLRLLVHLGKIKKPQILSTGIGDKQNLRYFHRFAPFMHLKEPKYVSWKQYNLMAEKLVAETTLETATELFKQAKKKIDDNLDLLPDFVDIRSTLMTNIIVCNVLNSPVGKLKKFVIENRICQYPLFKLI